MSLLEIKQALDQLTESLEALTIKDDNVLPLKEDAIQQLQDASRTLGILSEANELDWEGILSEADQLLEVGA